MATEIIIPQAGESVTEGVVQRWVKNVGDYVKRDETILEVETDKATMEVPAPVAGVLTAQRVKEGDSVKIGASVGTIDEKAAGPAKAPATATVEAKAATPAPSRESAKERPAPGPVAVGVGAAEAR